MQSDAAASRDAAAKLVEVRLELAQIQDVPWGASPDEGDDPADVRDELEYDRQQIAGTLAALDKNGDFPEAAEIRAPFDGMMVALRQILDLVAGGRSEKTDGPSSVAAHKAAVADDALRKAGARLRADSTRTLATTRDGSAAVILALFAAFAFFYLRAARARRRSSVEAVTDALTGLGNRRALAADMKARADGEVLLALYDLDGFKRYNDDFGHPAGDALLERLGARLATVLGADGCAYRMGGDEFCVLAPGGDGELARRAAAALSGDGVSCSYGTASIPSDTSDPDVALMLADQRMYEHKAERRAVRLITRSVA